MNQHVAVGYASAAEIEQYFGPWAELCGVSETPLARYGQELVKARRRGGLGSAMGPAVTTALPAAISEHGPDGGICARSLVYTARLAGEVAGGLVARPQRWLIDLAAPHGVSVQMHLLVRVLKLELVAVEPLHQRTGIGAMLVARMLADAVRSDVHLVYGSYSRSLGLGNFYSEAGFTLAPGSHALDMSEVAGVTSDAPAGVGLVVPQDEQLVFQKLPGCPNVPVVPAQAPRTAVVH